MRGIILAIVLILFGFFAFFFYKYYLKEAFFQPKKDISSEISYALPIELTSEFNPLHNSATFYIEGYNEEDYTLELLGQWPEKVKNKAFESKITCDTGDITLTSGGHKGADGRVVDVKKESVDIEEFFDNISAGKGYFFSGLCKDTLCNEINKSCDLSLEPKVE